MTGRWWWPTPKWWTLLVTSAAGVASSTIITGWDATERGMAGLAVVSLAATWAKSNKKATVRRRRHNPRP